MALPKVNTYEHSPTFLRDVIAEVLANNGVRPTDTLVKDLLDMVVKLRAEARTDREVINQYIKDTLKEVGLI
jgi:citrate lyase gamma subunit